jgi:predicted Zn-dependent protease with MMP-like domain
VTRKHFDRLVAAAVRGIPKRFRDEMDNVAVVVEDQPSPELLEEMGVVPPETLYGLYQGTPLPDREWTHANVLPDRITIYQQPIVEDSDDDDDIIRTIGETVIHEFGHYFGLSEEEIEEIESRYWRGETDPDEE